MKWIFYLPIVLFVPLMVIFLMFLCFVVSCKGCGRMCSRRMMNNRKNKLIDSAVQFNSGVVVVKNASGAKENFTSVDNLVAEEV